MNRLRNLNWWFIAAVLFSLGVWAVVIWALYYGIKAVQ